MTEIEPHPYPSARVREALAEVYDRSAPPTGWPGPSGGDWKPINGA